MQILQLPATISKIVTMGLRSLRLQIDTQENLSDEQMQKILSSYDTLGYFTFQKGEKMIDPADLLNLPKLVTEDKKTPSQRLRNTLFILWKQEGEKGSFDLFYIDMMNKFINHIKDKLEPYDKERHQ